MSRDGLPTGIVGVLGYGLLATPARLLPGSEKGEPRSAREIRRDLVRAAVKSLSAMLGEPEATVLARLFLTSGVWPRQIRRWARDGPPDGDTWHAFLDGVDALERGALLRNLKQFSGRANGQLCRKVGRRLRQLREQEGVGRWTIAARLHVSPDEVMAWEAGRARPGLEDLVLMQRFFGIVPEAVCPEGA